MLGAGTLLASTLDDKEAARDRLIALLATAYRGRIPAGAPVRLEKALAAWRGGDKFIAAAHLAYARLPPLALDDAYRLFLADVALDAGATPDRLLADLGYADLAAGLGKYDPAQPRVSAGPHGGEWAGVGDAPASKPAPDHVQVAANTTTNFGYACKKLNINPNDASTALHAAKRKAELGGAAQCVFDLRTGDIFFQGEHIGNLGD